MRPLMLHLDIDAFFASVEQLRNPRLSGRPVAVGTGVIASCSYEARRFGLSAGMPLGRAQRLCPSLIVVEGHQAIYRCYAEHIFALCQQWTPQVETFLDEAYCDLSGTGRLYPDPLRIGHALKESIFQEIGLRVTVGLGRNRMFARLAGKRAKPDGLTLLPEEAEEELLLSLPIGDLPGIGGKTRRLFESLEIRTIAELRELPRSALIALLGENGRIIHERCHGHDHRVLARPEIPRTISRETAFHEDTDDPREIEGMLQYLVERAARTLRGRGLEAGSLAVRIGYSDHAHDERRRRFPSPTAIDRILIRDALELRRELHRRRVALRRIGITLHALRPAPLHRQVPLFDDGDDLIPAAEARRQRRLLASLDAIRDRYGYASLITGRSLHLLAATRSDGRKLARDAHGFILRTPCLTQ